MVKKILIVDDEPQILEMVKIRLEANRYEVITASCGEEGIKKATEENPDLIFLDIMMPGLDGFETLRKLKSSDKTSSIPVIMLTAKSETRSIFEAKGLKATDYLIKPYKPEALLKAISRYAL